MSNAKRSVGIAGDALLHRTQEDAQGKVLHGGIGVESGDHFEQVAIHV